MGELAYTPIKQGLDSSPRQATGRPKKRFVHDEVPVWVEEKYRAIDRQHPTQYEKRSDAWLLRQQGQGNRSLKRSGLLFSGDSCRLAILESLSMAWTADKYKNVDVESRD